MSHLGDIAQTLPLLHGVRAAWPDAEVAWAIQPEFAGLVEPLVERIVPFARRGGAGAWPRIRRAMRSFGPDLAIDAQGNWKSAAATRLSGARWRATLPYGARQEPAAARVFRLVEAAPDAEHRHLVPLMGALTEALTGAPPERMDPALTEVERSAGVALWKKAGGAHGAVVLHPGVEGDPRSWPLLRYERLAKALTAADRRVLVLTGPAEIDVGERLRAALPDAQHLVGQCGLRELCALFEAAGRARATLVTGDSGPSHVAASVGLAVRLIAGPENPARTGPWPPRGGLHAVVADPSTETPWVPRSIEDVSVDDVLASLTSSR